MVSYGLRVVHGHCASCGERSENLYTLNLTAGELPRIEPKQERTHAGLCEGCLLRIALSIRLHFRPRVVTVR